jgi:hypothetical protein
MTDNANSAVLDALRSLHGPGTSPLGALVSNTLPLGQNQRPFTTAVDCEESGKLSRINLLTRNALKAQCAGFRSARITGPLRVLIVGEITDNSSAWMAEVLVGLGPGSWPDPEPLNVSLCPTLLVLNKSMTGGVSEQTFTLPDGFRDNVLIAQPMGEDPHIFIAPSFKGYQKIRVLISGTLTLEGMMPLQPWAAARPPARA